MSSPLLNGTSRTVGSVMLLAEDTQIEGLQTRAGSISIIFVDVDYRFFSIIFDDFDFGFDVDFLYNRDFDFDYFLAELYR
jgi:hypothetical protein